MRNSLLVTATLTLSGLIASGVGASILTIPQAFHASSGIAVADDVNLLNEVRASGGLVLAAGLFAFLGAARAAFAGPALLVSAALYLSYGLARLLSMVVDGLPNAALTQVTVLELVLGGLCLIALRATARAEGDAAPA